MAVGRSGVTLSSSKISAWADKSGKAHNATQTVAANRPTVVANTLNGKPVVHFVGNPGTAGAGQWLNLPNILSGQAQAEVMVVVRASSATGGGGLWNFGTNDVSEYSDGTKVIQDGFGSSTLQVEGQPSQDITQFHVYQVSQTGYWETWIDGVPLYLTTTNTAAFNSAPTLGENKSRYGFSGDIAEIVVYNRALSTAERATVLAYFTARYAILPAPATPTGLTVINETPTQNTISWNWEQTGNPITYVISRKTGTTGTYSQIATVSGTGTYVDSTITSGQQYFYTIQATSAGGTSAVSAAVGEAIAMSEGGTVPIYGMSLWLMANGAWESPVGYLPDYSGSGHDAWQNTYASKPTLVANSVNGQPAIHFAGSGTSQFWNFPALPNYPNALSGATAGEAVIVVRSAASPGTAGGGLWSFGGYSLDNEYPNSSGQIQDDFGSYNLNDASPPTNDANFHIYEVATQSANTSPGAMHPQIWENWIDGLPLSYVNSGYPRTSGVFFNATPKIGENYNGVGFNGDVAEVLVFNNILSPAARQGLLFYLNQKYAILPAPPVPTGLQANALNETAVMVTWNEAITNVPISYAVWRQQDAGAWTLAGTVSGGNTFLDSALMSSSSYQYEVQAISGPASSAFTAPAAVNRNLAAVEAISTSGMTLWMMAEGAVENPVNYIAGYSVVGNNAWTSGYTPPSLLPNTLNGKPVLHFDGPSKQSLGFVSATTGAASSETLIVLRSTATAGASNTLWSFGSPGYAGMSYNNGALIDTFASGNVYTEDAFSQDLSQFHVYDVCSQANSWQSWLDGTPLYTANSNSYYTSPYVEYLGMDIMGDYFTGDVAEMVMFNRPLSASERESWVQYFGIKYLLGGLDPDGDGLTTAQEIALGLNPLNPHSAGGSILDGTAVDLGLNPLNPATLSFYPNPNGPPATTPLTPGPGVPVLTLISPAGLTLQH